MLESACGTTAQRQIRKKMRDIFGKSERSYTKRNLAFKEREMKQSTQRTLALVLCALCVVCLVFIAACNKPGDVTPGETTLERIEIAKQPNKTEYNVGEKFSRSGMVVKAYYSEAPVKT